MKFKIGKMQALIGLSFYFITLANAKWLYHIGHNTKILYIGLFFLMVAVAWTWFCYERYKLKTVLRTITYNVLFNVGIILQNLDIKNKIRLIISMTIIAILAGMGRTIFRDIRDVFIVSKSVIYAGISVFILSVLTKTSMGTQVNDVGRLLETGFDMGFYHKNYFAAAIIVSFVGIYLNYKYGKKRRKLLYLMGIELLLLLLSGSLGSFMIFASFIFVDNLCMIRKIKKDQRKVILIVILLFSGVVGLLAYSYLIKHSATYMYRIRGLTNYLNKYHNNINSMLFGIAGVAYSGADYGTIIRSIVGWDGTVELAVLNILIKNGIIGLIAYALIYLHYIRTVLVGKESLIFFGMAIITMTLVSMLTENYMVITNIVFGVFFYCFMSSISLWVTPGTGELKNE